MDVLRSWLLELTEQVGWRLRRHKLRGRTVQLKVRFADFSPITRSQTLPEPTNITDELWRVADEMLCHRLPSGHLPVRLVGMGVSSLDNSGQVQGLLFDQQELKKQSRDGRRGRPDQRAVWGGGDSVRQPFGTRIVATSLAQDVQLALFSPRWLSSTTIGSYLLGVVHLQKSHPKHRRHAPRLVCRTACSVASWCRTTALGGIQFAFILYAPPAWIVPASLTLKHPGRVPLIGCSRT